MNYFERLELALPDAILGLNTTFAKDARKQKVNLGVGAYKTAELKPLVLGVVKQAEKELLAAGLYKEYLPIDGDPTFQEQTTKLVFGARSSLIAEKRIATFQTVGGTGALAVAVRFLKLIGLKTIYLSDPTWGNHKRIFSDGGLECETYPYYNKKKRAFDFEAMLAALEKMELGGVVLLQGACHNPTGFDPTSDEWLKILDVVKRKRLMPLFDCAYQGFGDSIEKDMHAVRLFAEEGIEVIVATSYSKNFGLYAERVGALFVVCHDQTKAEAISSRVKLIIRGLYSNPPCHGAHIVAKILSNSTLKELWEKELGSMQSRIFEMRKSFVAKLCTLIPERSFDFILKQKGMFSYTGISEGQVDELQRDFGIYLTRDGRVNVAGLNTENLEYVVEAFKAVC